MRADQQRSLLLRTDAAMRRVRWVAIPFVLIQFVLYQPPEGVSVPYSLLPIGGTIALILGAINLVSLRSRRILDPERLRRIGLGQLCADTLVVLGITWIFAFDPVSALWALLVVPVLEGALRAELRGAMLTWTAIAAAYPFRELGAVMLYPDPQYQLGSITYRLGIVLIVALTSGYLARNLRQHAEASDAATRESDRRAELLHTVATAGRAMSIPETGRVLAAVVDAALEIGFDGSEICLFDDADDSYRITHPRGLPDTYQASFPADTGIAGRAYRERSTVLVSDYATWPDGVPQVQQAGYRAVVATPIWTGGKLEAVLAVGTKEARLITPDEIECLELLATQAGAALNNARRFADRRLFEERLAHQAFHDALTGLPNRALFLNRLQHALDLKVREPSPLAVLYIDLDHFKRVNDSLGHDRGDELLQAVAERLEQCLRPGDTVSRFGGDEFTVLLEQLTSEQGAVASAMRILEALQDRFTISGRDVFVSASIGIAYGSSADRRRDFLQDADLAMYRAKEQGGGRCELYRFDMTERARRRLEMENQLRSALRDGELRLLYQPLVSLATGALYGFEALVRWDHPTRGRLRPNDFIPIAEESGLIVPLGEWVLTEAWRQAQIWASHLPERPSMCVNISAKEFRHPGFVDRLRELVGSGGDADLVLEVTESVVMRDDLAMHDLTERIQALGIHLAIDDFGLGYSSLAYLKRFAFKILKIDRSFVTGLTYSFEDQAIVRSIVALAQDLGLNIVAEGVETSEQLDYLRDIGCDVVQGFHLFEPLEGETVHRLLQDRGGVFLPDALPGGKRSAPGGLQRAPDTA